MNSVKSAAQSQANLPRGLDTGCIIHCDIGFKSNKQAVQVLVAPNTALTPTDDLGIGRADRILSRATTAKHFHGKGRPLLLALAGANR